MGGTLLVLPLFAFGYSENTTHPALTQEIIKFFNRHYPERAFTDDERAAIMRGSIEEDDGTRALHHFYDPVHERGLEIADQEWQSSKEWAEDTMAQAEFTDELFAGTVTSYFSGEDDHSWQRAIYEYAWGSKTRGLESLGHILHLIEDATVPDHTRNDPHPPVLDFGSPYEAWTAQFAPKNLSLTEKLATKQPLLLPTLQSYFDAAATYSNNNFFSKDTISNTTYTEPRIAFYKKELLNNGVTYTFGYSSKNFRLIRVDQDADWYSTISDHGQDNTYLEDPQNLILSDYWSLLSEQAVVNGAGVVKLFFDEVEKERQSKVLYEKNRSWLEKQVVKVKTTVTAWTSAAVSSIAGFFSGSDAPSETPSTNEAGAIIAAVAPTEQPSGAVLGATDEPAAPPTAPEPLVPDAEQIIPESIAQTPTPVPEPQQATPTTPQNAAVPAPFFSVDTSAGVPIGGSGAPPQTAPETPPEPASDAPPPPPPDLLFSIAECSRSLSRETCLVATGTLSLVWTSDAEDIDHYDISCETGGGACEQFNHLNASATGTSYTLPLANVSYRFSARAVALSGAMSDPDEITVIFEETPVIINEISWAGAEWIELFNPTPYPIALAGVTLRSLAGEDPVIPLSGELSARSYYLIEPEGDESIANVLASSTAPFGAGLPDAGAELALTHAASGAILDRTPPIDACGGWCGGAGGGQHISMERERPAAPGALAASWGSWAGFVGHGADQDGRRIGGTPGTRNSINYLIARNNELSASAAIGASNSPYVVPSSILAIRAGATLTIQPGVVIKFLSGGGILAEGAVDARGTAAEPVVFTSFADDGYAGDTNEDGAASSPRPGDWGALRLAGDGSTLERTVIRYGGQYEPHIDAGANIRVEGAAATIADSVVEYGRTLGAWLKNARGGVSGTTFRTNGIGAGSSGALVDGGDIAITASSFSNSDSGLRLTGGATSRIAGNAFRDNADFAVQSVGAYPAFSGNSASGNKKNGINLQGTLDRDFSIAADLPYVSENTEYTVPAGNTLTVAPGTLFKLSGAGAIAVRGALSAEGTAEEKIVFTSLADDEYGGDTNNDGSESWPQPGDWLHIRFEGDGASASRIAHAVIRYGGNTHSPGSVRGAVRIVAAAPAIENTVVENNDYIGVAAENSAAPEIVDSVIRNHLDESGRDPFYGIMLAASSTPAIRGTTFSNNYGHILADPTSSWIDGGGNNFE